MDKNRIQQQLELQQLMQVPGLSMHVPMHPGMQPMSSGMQMAMTNTANQNMYPVQIPMQMNMQMPIQHMQMQGMNPQMMMSVHQGMPQQMPSHLQMPMHMPPPLPSALTETTRPVVKKKKVITPYIRFCTEQRPYLKLKYPEATFIELGKMFGRMWNQLTDIQKSKYSTPTSVELADDNDGEDRTSTRKKKTKRKKMITPYIRFCSEQRPFLKQKFPDATFIELGKMFGRIWNQLTDVQKSKYSIPVPGENESDDDLDEEEEEVKPKKQKVITPYIRFCSEQRPFLKQKYPEMVFTDMGKMFGRMWNQLTDEQKAQYVAPPPTDC
jgi:hypothetical protein